jgi:FKBP-type peptidyl-prolyl cis-trans isomerase 2
MKKGDFVEIDFIGRLVTTGEIFDLNSGEEAKREGIYNPKHKYKPSLVVIGSGMSVPGMEKNLEEMKVGEEREFTLNPDEAFGQKNMRLMRIVPITKFTKEKISPVPGMFVDIDGMQAKVLSVAGGRVRVDFNHPLAGKVLKYKVKIVREVTETQEKSNLLLSYYGIKCDTKVDGDTIVIETEKPMNEFLRKFAGENVMKWVSEVKNIQFTEKEGAKAPSAAEPKPKSVKEKQPDEENKKA